MSCSMKDCLKERDEAAIRQARQEHPGSSRGPAGAPKRYQLSSYTKLTWSVATALLSQNSLCLIRVSNFKLE